MIVNIEVKVIYNEIVVRNKCKYSCCGVNSFVYFLCLCCYFCFVINYFYCELNNIKKKDEYVCVFEICILWIFGVVLVLKMDFFCGYVLFGIG